MRRILALAAALMLVGVACEGNLTDRLRPEALISTPSPVPEATATGLVAERPATAPTFRFENHGLGASKARVKQAMADLKAVKLWDDLTDHLYMLVVATRPGLSDVPDDGHLADALLTAAIDEFGMGAACDVMFFPAAIRKDLERWEGYYSQDLVPDEPPTPRQYWAAIMGHELAHCLNWEGREPFAEKWEAKVLETLREAGLE